MNEWTATKMKTTRTAITARYGIRLPEGPALNPSDVRAHSKSFVWPRRNLRKTIARQLEREQITTNREREFALEQSLGEFRVGRSKALNAVPLTRGTESEIS